jgi:hypothetical protein
MRAIACLRLAAADQGADKPLCKTKAESLAAIPPDAEAVCQSAAGGEKSGFGPPATGIYVATAEGGHLTRITHQRKLYNHIAVSPDRKTIAAGRFNDGDTGKDGAINAPVPQADDACLGGIPKPVFVSDMSVSFDWEWIVFLCVTKAGEMCRLAGMRMHRSEAHFITDGGGPGNHNDLMRIRIEGTDLLRLSPEAGSVTRGISDWSRDNQFVFSEWNLKDQWVRWIPPLG